MTATENSGRPQTAVHSIGRPWHICRQFKRVRHQSQDFSDGSQALQPMQWCSSSRRYAWCSWGSASTWGKTRSPALCWFRLTYLTQLMETFEFGYMEVANRPTPIQRKMLNSGDFSLQHKCGCWGTHYQHWLDIWYQKTMNTGRIWCSSCALLVTF